MSRTLSYLSAFLGSLTLIRLPPGKLSLALWIPKMLLQGLTPLAAVMGSLGTLMGLARRERRTTGIGLFGTAVAVRHVIRVTAPHDSFEQTFGPDWRSRIPPELQAHMLPERWSPLMKKPPRVPWQRNVTFGASPETGNPLLADVWQPPEGLPRTGLVVIYLHGGAWYYGKKDMGTRPFFRHLAGQGHVIMDVEYTRAPQAKLFGQVADVKRAIAWMKANAAEYGANPERIVLMGGSAGAHLALLTAYTTSHPEFQPEDVMADTSVRAVVSYYGPTDLTDAIPHVPSGPFFESLARGWLGGTFEEAPEVYRLGSPITHVGPHCPPTLLLQGTHDFGVPPSHARRLHQALREAGVTSVHVEFPNTEHAFDFPIWSPAGQAATYDTERFLALMV